MRIEMSRTAAVAWGLVFFLFTTWIFALGLFVGKGMLPEKVESAIQVPLQKLQVLLAKTRASEPEPPVLDAEDPKLSFYRKLSSKKDEAAMKEQERTSPAEEPRTKEIRAPAIQQPQPPASGYTVQLASLDQQERASAMVNRLTQRGYPAYFYRVEIAGNPYYRVRCGSFGQASDAANLRDQLAREEKLQGFVIHAER